MVAVVLALALLLMIWKRVEIQDYLLGWGYEPTAEMAEIREELGLTARARRIFDASWPELEEREEFNQNCRAGGEGDLAILGCYTNERIYIYNIVSDELVGVRETSTAHELLHAVWVRLTDGERNALDDDLNAVLAQNAWLVDELAVYGKHEWGEELYVRVGTEVRNLPEALERHYAGIFDDQDRIVEYYEEYIAVFREIEGRMAEISERLEHVQATLDAAAAAYEQKVGQLNAEVVSFNACAVRVGCFATEAEYNSRLALLLQEQKVLMAEYEEINRLVDQYNALVDDYNSNVVHGQMLNNAINSLAVPEI